MVQEPPFAGPRLLAAVLGFGLLGVLLGIVSAFLVPVGWRFGAHGGTGGDSTSTVRAAAAASTTMSYGTLISVGVGLAFVGCLLLGMLGRRVAGVRLVALAPVSGWLFAALAALSEHHESLVLPAVITPGITYLYAGVIGGAISLLPPDVLRILRGRNGRSVSSAG